MYLIKPTLCSKSQVNIELFCGLSWNEPCHTFFRQEFPIVGIFSALIKFKAANVKTGYLIIVVSELLVIGDVGNIVDNGS